MNFAFEDESEASPVTPGAKPRHTFSADLEFSPVATYTNDVKMLQECLKYLGIFPSNVDSTGYFGAVTKKAVEQFQLREGIATPGVDGFGRVGPRTRAVLNRLFA
jgi:peptidoglycan hydrolase-like protein with peptidoglycan-binding domain